MKTATLVAGDTLYFKTAVPQYPANEGWMLTYRLVPRSSGTAIVFDASADGPDYVIQIGPSITSVWEPGNYSWFAYVQKTGERYQVEEGAIEITPDYATAETLDNRSHARKTLEAIEAVIEKRATQDQMAYTIGTRQLQRMPIKDLISFRNQYRAEVYGEEQKEAAEAGRGSARVVVRL